jgi:hypothetical protein
MRQKLGKNRWVECHAPPFVGQLGQLAFGVSKIKGALSKLGLLAEIKRWQF